MKKKIFDEIHDTEVVQNKVAMIADFDGDETRLYDIELPDVMAILPLRNMVLFPGVVLPVSIGRDSSLRLVRDMHEKDMSFGCICQRDKKVDIPKNDDLYEIGTIGRIIRLLDMPDGSITAIIQGQCRFRMGQMESLYPYDKARVTKMPETFFKEDDDDETKAIIDSVKESVSRFVSTLDMLQQETLFAMRNISNPSFLINFVCANIPMSIEKKMDLLCEDSVKERAIKLLSYLSQEINIQKIKARIQAKTKEELDKQQRDYFLQQEMKNIQTELGINENNDYVVLSQKAKQKKWNDSTAEIFNRELEKLSRLNPQSPDYNVQLSYLQTVVSLPWNELTKDNLSIANAKKQLDKDHFGLDKVKERILEHLAVLKLRGNMKSPILCLYGPPGVGKTSLGKSIADALKRKYIRISLGGVHDESEIRGHRKTYIGAMVGRIIKGIQKAGSANPVFILDEIDKIGQNGANGDPSSALLEVLDPEQNNAFHDNYLDMDYDLSNVMFIATANDINTIPRPLLDRMELIDVSGYLTEEKIEIANSHLIPKIKKELGLKGNNNIKIPRPTIEYIIENYTRESGVRNLDKNINKLFRKLALAYATDEKFPYSTIKKEHVEQLLGKPAFSRDIYQGNDYAGVVTGLAWTSVGGEILFVETSLSKGKASKLTLTGNLGDVMKESAVLALEYIKAHADKYKIDPEIFDNWNIHIHVPEGATPKDGPSAGITIATSLASALTQRKVRANIAMTGEITLRGKVLPVGGIKEKILAAKRAGITDIIICKDNRKDIEEIPEIYVKGVTFHYVETVRDVLDFALLDEKVKDPVDFTIPKTETKEKN